MAEMLRNLLDPDWDYFGPTNLGVLGSQVPADSVASNDSLDPDKYYRVEWTTVPAGITIYTDIAGVGYADPDAPGVYIAQYVLWEDGVDYSPVNATFESGDSQVEGTLDAVAPSPTFTGAVYESNNLAAVAPKPTFRANAWLIEGASISITAPSPSFSATDTDPSAPEPAIGLIAVAPAMSSFAAYAPSPTPTVTPAETGFTILTKQYSFKIL